MRLAMSTKEEIQRLKALGHKKNTVANKLNIDWRTVDRYWNSIEQEEVPPPLWAINIDWKDVLEQIRTGSMATHIYEALKANNELPSYSAFTRYLSKVKSNEKTKSIVIRLPKVPGKELEVDYSGNSIPILSPSSGEVLRTELFVGCLPCSSYIYGEFTFSQKLDDFIYSHVNMFKHLKGVPLFLIPDNAKVAVDKFHRYDPKLNLTYHDMAQHYGVGISPARVRKPKDKASVERAIGIIQQQFFPEVKNKTYTSIHELNKDFRVWLNKFNNKTMKSRGVSRSQLLEEERPSFRALPEEEYEFFHWKSVKVHPDCHYAFEKNYYSVPHQFVGRELLIKYNSKLISAYWQREKVYTHVIQKGHGHYQTNPEHYPKEKIAHYNYSIQKSIKDATETGEYTLAVINKLLSKGVHPLANLKKIQGILNLRRKYSSEELEYGCEMAIISNKLFYQYINNCCKNANYVSQKSESLLPKRDQKFICLQGGFDNDGSTKTPSNS